MPRPPPTKPLPDLAEKDKQISGLESQNQDLEQDLHGNLRNSMTNKAAGNRGHPEKSCAASERGNAAWSKELKNLQAQKEELEKRFSDLAVAQGADQEN